MSDIDLSQQIQKLKDEEEKQLAEMRLKRFFELEAIRREIEKRSEEEEVKNLTKQEAELTQKLSDIRKKTFQLKTEATCWENLAKSKTLELKNLERKLNDSYDKIWRNREDFCLKIDSFLGNIKLTELPRRETNTYDNTSEESIRKLKESLAAEMDLEQSYTKKLNELLQEKEKLQQVPNDPKYKRLEEWIQITRDRCRELETRLNDKRKLTDRKNNPGNNQLFSIVNLEDVKRLTQKFK